MSFPWPPYHVSSTSYTFYILFLFPPLACMLFQFLSPKVLGFLHGDFLLGCGDGRAPSHTHSPWQMNFHTSLIQLKRYVALLMIVITIDDPYRITTPLDLLTIKKGGVLQIILSVFSTMMCQHLVDCNPLWWFPK
jgi:hypothetical protein